jgi:nitroreductase
LLPLSSQRLIDRALQPDAGQVEQLLMARRSIREYRPDPVPEETLTRLLSAARYAPTGVNMQGCAFRVISRPELLRQLSRLTLAWAEEELRLQTPFSALVAPIVKSGRITGRDVILRDAPFLVLSLLQQPMLPLAVENGRFPLLYASLFAPSLGLGTCFAGIFEQCVRSGYAPLLDALALPDGMGFAGAIIAGFPGYSHARIPSRNPLNVTWQR